MTWQFQKISRKVYERNPLDTVVAQLKFQPILRIAAGKGIPEFQDLVRKQFPGYGEGELRSLTVSPDTKVSSKSEKVFHFVRTDDKTQVQLSADNVVIESKSHQTRECLLQDLKSVTSSLISTFAPIDTVRFGVRYINLVSLETISSELERDVTWDTVIDKEYLTIPASVADLRQTTYFNQISSPMTIGAMTLRYGLMKSEEDSSTAFCFDIDRYIEGEISLETIGDTLIEFTDDIFSLFSTLPGKDLLDWMSLSKALSKKGDTQ